MWQLRHRASVHPVLKSASNKSSLRLEIFVVGEYQVARLERVKRPRAASFDEKKSDVNAESSSHVVQYWDNN